MDLNNNIGKAYDRISKLPDSLINHILSFLDIKLVARTCILSKRWKYIWTSIPTLVFPYFLPNPPSLSETNKFMEFVDRTLVLHDESNIQKCHLTTNELMSASRFHLWIENLTRRNIQELELWLDQDKPFYIPLSLFRCESLNKLELIANNGTRLPGTFIFPKLKSLKLIGIQFTDNDCWKEQHFSNCHVLEDLILEDCTWFGVSDFCISTPTLKLLEICNLTWAEEGLQNCALEIHVPNLVSLTYCGSVAREYVLSSFQTLESAKVHLCEYGNVLRKQQIGFAAYLRKLYLETYAETLESCIDENEENEHSWASHMLTAGCMFQHLQSVTYVRFSGNEREMRWVKLISKNAKDLRTIRLYLRSDDLINKKVLKSEFQSLPKASESCEFEFKEC
ncbi:F-box/LRR-repeat protein At4g14103-like [Papaver somniferum]|uniref:F-box/LRR-repeat protein At4g14103-like n=1 Tax=Papaver somniferum TaxID=3469 RepID=UPI000E6F6642|nr:F-box/LRR-repeat protein At4g14103-like [Papaver somniferum]